MQRNHFFIIDRRVSRVAGTNGARPLCYGRAKRGVQAFPLARFTRVIHPGAINETAVGTIDPENRRLNYFHVPRDRAAVPGNRPAIVVSVKKDLPGIGGDLSSLPFFRFLSYLMRPEFQQNCTKRICTEDFLEEGLFRENHRWWRIVFKAGTNQEDSVINCKSLSCDAV